MRKVAPELQGVQPQVTTAKPNHCTWGVLAVKRPPDLQGHDVPADGANVWKAVSWCVLLDARYCLANLQRAQLIQRVPCTRHKERGWANVALSSAWMENSDENPNGCGKAVPSEVEPFMVQRDDIGSVLGEL